MRGNTPGDQVRHAIRDHPRLSRSRPGQDQVVAVGSHHSGPLRLVQVVVEMACQSRGQRMLELDLSHASARVRVSAVLCHVQARFYQTDLVANHVLHFPRQPPTRPKTGPPACSAWEPRDRRIPVQPIARSHVPAWGLVAIFGTSPLPAGDLGHAGHPGPASGREDGRRAHPRRLEPVEQRPRRPIYKGCAERKVHDRRPSLGQPGGAGLARDGFSGRRAGGQVGDRGQRSAGRLCRIRRAGRWRS